MIEVVIHAWTVKVVRWAEHVSTGKFKARPCAVTQYVCDRCGETLPENHSPMPWWIDMTGLGTWLVKTCKAPTPRHTDPALDDRGLVEES